jgi:Sulfotransferase family
MDLLITNKNNGNRIYVSWLKQLEENYDNPVMFKTIVKLIKEKIHSGIYNRSELLNVWKQLTDGLGSGNESIKKSCETNIKCLVENKIEFLNYHHDNQAMINLLRNSDFKLFQDVLFQFRDIRKLTGFHHYRETKFSMNEDLNINCPIMNCLELMFNSKTKDEFIHYRMKMEFLLYLLKKYFNKRFNFTIRYVLNGKIQLTTPLLEAIRSNNQFMINYIKSKGGTLDYKFNEFEPCNHCERSYYNFFNVERVNMPLMEYLKEHFPIDYKRALVHKDKDGTRKNMARANVANSTRGIIQQRKLHNQQKHKPTFNQPSISLNNNNLNTMEQIKERIKLNKYKSENLLKPLNQSTKFKLKRFWSDTNSNSNSENQSSNNTKEKENEKESQSPYVVVGGVGGSGTRLIASILATLGLNIGTDLNEAYDNLSYTLLFKHESVIGNDPQYGDKYNLLQEATLGKPFKLSDNDERILEELSAKGRPGHPSLWLKERAHNIHKISEKGGLDNEYLNKLPSISKQPLKGKWGWKEPNSHMLMDRLHEQSKNTKFIMVVRNGLDMSISQNQNQLRLWGPHVLPQKYLKFDSHGHIIETPEASLKYWVLTHKKVLEVGKKYGKNFLMINFDDMCIHKEKWLTILCDFLGVDSSLVPELVPQIRTPTDLGRFKTQDLSKFEHEDIDFVKKMGFDIENGHNITVKKRLNKPVRTVRFRLDQSPSYPSVVIGAVGGSGTRLIASMMYAMGVNMGTNLNSSFDNNVFVYLFRRKDTLKLTDEEFTTYMNIMYKTFGMKKGLQLTDEENNIIDTLSTKLDQQLTLDWLHKHADIIKRMVTVGPEEGLSAETKKMLEDTINTIQLTDKPLANTWGWKAPNSHVIMSRLHREYPKMKYIMVIRNGLDMAFSDNRNQLEMWGPLLFSKKERSHKGWAKSPRLALKYWCIVHKRVLEEAKSMGKQFYLLEYERMCETPNIVIEELLDFMEIKKTPLLIQRLSGLIKPSEGIGRFRKENMNQFDKEDVEYVRSLGYPVE